MLLVVLCDGDVERVHFLDQVIHSFSMQIELLLQRGWVPGLSHGYMLWRILSSACLNSSSASSNSFLALDLDICTNYNLI